MNAQTLDPKTCRKARLARDARFDGLFFTAVKTTGIYCRPICPATSPKEENIHYYSSAIEAANDGYRPCLRCRPDSSPFSPAWLGTEVTFQRALQLIDQGALADGDVNQLSDRLGIGDRYLRRLFEKYLGTSPKKYAQYQQCLFAKQLLHQTQMSVTQIALASGFNSVRRFNDCFKKQLAITPSDVRKTQRTTQHVIQLTLSFRPPFDWEHLLSFYRYRQIDGIECVSDNSYSRSIQLDSSFGVFTARRKNESSMLVELQLNEWVHLNAIVKKIRQQFDLDAQPALIQQTVSQAIHPTLNLRNGIRIPGVWDIFETGIRAILGQQVSVKAANQLVTQLVKHLGEKNPLDPQKPDSFDVPKRLFPSPQSVIASDLEFLKMPQSRRETLRRFAQWYVEREQDNGAAQSIDTLLDVKGIGPWTVDYIKMRGLSDPDIWLGSDLGVKNAIKKCGVTIDLEAAKPWRSYLSFHLWDQL